MYWSNDEERQALLNLRPRLLAAFPFLRDHRRVWDTPIGPHLLPMWECDFGAPGNAEHRGSVEAWLRREHGLLSVLMHPHSMDGAVADHTTHAVWIGRPVSILLERL